MSDDKVDIFKRYSHEINKIENLLIDLNNGRVYEVERKPGIPKCSTMAERLKSEIEDLLIKINNNEKGFMEVASEAINKLSFH